MTFDSLPIKRPTKELLLLLKQTLPFQSVPDSLLKAIIAASKIMRWEFGQIIFDIGSAADDLYVVISGEIELIFTQTTELESLSKIMRSGAVFGWDALFKNQSKTSSQRLAKAIVRDEAEIMAVNADELETLFYAEHEAYRTMMNRFVMMIAHESSVPAAWAGGDN
jgi:NitT/TauT family transport system permease protein